MHDFQIHVDLRRKKQNKIKTFFSLLLLLSFNVEKLGFHETKNLGY